MNRALVLTALIALLGSPVATPVAAGTAKLERVVMLMRHGIRPPTKAEPVPAGFSDKPWPEWPVKPGLLTPRGAAGVTLLGNGDRAYWISKGLLPAEGCPAGAVTAAASAKQRALRTAESYVAALMPGCDIPVEHPAPDGDDPVFHTLEGVPATFDGHAAFLDAQKMLPKGGLATELRAYRAELVLLQRALGCCAPILCDAAKQPAACPISSLPSVLIENRNDRPNLEGPLGIGSTASQTFLLEYLEGMPMADVAWGRATRADIEKMLRFHPVKFRYENRPEYIARRAGSALAARLVAALAAPAGASKVALFAGHDTNLADVASLFGLHWKVPSYPTDDIPPGSALGFELWTDAHGGVSVRAFFRAQTMDQLRNQVPLDATTQPFRQYLSIPGCGSAPCPLAKFQGIAAARIIRIN